MIFNPEKALDSLVDEMNDEEYEEYQTFWDQKGPWRTALNTVTRGALMVLIVALGLDYKLGILSACTVGGVALGAYLILAGWVNIFCARLYLKVFIRLDQS